MEHGGKAELLLASRDDGSRILRCAGKDGRGRVRDGVLARGAEDGGRAVAGEVHACETELASPEERP